MTPPTTSQLKDNIVSGLQASIGQTIPIFPKSFTRVLAAVLAGAFILLWKYVGFVGLQMFVSQASGSPTTINGKIVVPLVEWGRLLGVGDPNPALPAQLLIAVPVKVQTGSLPSGSKFVRADTGVIYRSVAAVPLNAPTVQVTVRAISDQAGGDGSGSIGNLQTGDVVSFSNTPLNVGSDCTVVSQIVTGADAESVEVYRARVMARAAAKPQGGAYADYRDWALEVPGIISVYPYAGLPGVVDVYCEADFASSGSADGIPTGAQLTEVLNSINLDVGGIATRRPVNAAPNPRAIVRTGFAVTVRGLTATDVPTAESLIASACTEFFLGREPFIVGLSSLPRQDRVTEAALAGIIEAVCDSIGAGVTSVSVVPGPAYDLGNGEKAKLSGAVTFL